MIKQQVQVKVLVAHFQPVLPPHEGKSPVEFQQKLFDVPDQLRFQFSFLDTLPPKGSEILGLPRSCGCIAPKLTGFIQAPISNIGGCIHIPVVGGVAASASPFSIFQG